MLLIARVFFTSLSFLITSFHCGHARNLNYSRSSDESITLSREHVKSLKLLLLAGARTPVASYRLDAVDRHGGILLTGPKQRLQRRRHSQQTQMTDVTDKNAQIAVAPALAPSADKNAQIMETALVDKQDASKSNTEKLLRATLAENANLRDRLDELERSIGETQDPCEVLDDGGGWTSSIGRRSAWLLGLLVCQSFSSSILAANEPLLTGHPTVIFFLTMLVGAGGNAGNQAAVRIIRGLATGEISPDASERTKAIVSDEMVRAVALACIVVVAGFARVILFEGSMNDAVAISTSLFFVVSISVVLGTLLPLILQSLKIDAANASTSIQVIMDVLGVLITCIVAPEVFELLEHAP